MATILIKDIVPQAAQIIAQLLRGSGNHISFVASNDESALELLEKNSFDLIIIDHRIRQMGDLELLKYLRGHEKYRSLPIIVTSATELIGPTALAEGANEFLLFPLPSTKQQLVEAVSRYLHKDRPTTRQSKEEEQPPIFHFRHEVEQPVEQKIELKSSNKHGIDAQEYIRLEEYLKRNVEAQARRGGQYINIHAFLRKVKTLAPELKCPVCGRQMLIDNEAPPKHKLHIEHILPISKGGSNRVENLFPLCGDCNMSKGDKEVKDWYFGAKVATINNNYHGYEVTEQPPIVVKKRDIKPGQYWTLPNGIADAERQRETFIGFHLTLHKRIEPTTIGGLICNTITYEERGVIYYENVNYDEDYEREIAPKRYWPANHTPTHKLVRFGELEVGESFFGLYVSPNHKYTKLKKHIFNWHNAKSHIRGEKTDFNEDVLVLVPVRRKGSNL